MVAIEVKTTMGTTATLEVDTTWTAAELRKAVCAAVSVDMGKVDLIAGGSKVEDTADANTDATSSTHQAMEAVRRGSTVHVVPKTRTGFSMRKDEAGPSIPGLELKSPDDIAKFLTSVQGLDAETLAQASVGVMVEGPDGQLVKARLPLADLTDTLKQLEQQLSGGKVDDSSSGPAIAMPAPHVLANLAARTEAPAMDEDARRREQQRLYDLGVEMYKEREQKKSEASRITSKLDALREKRAARAARKQRRAQRRRTPSVAECDAAKRTKLAPPVPAAGFGGLRKGFLM